MPNWKTRLNAFRTFLAPATRFRWWPFAQQLETGERWGSLMLLWSILVVGIGMAIVVGLLAGGEWLEQIDSSTSMTWTAFTVLGVMITIKIARPILVISRLGVHGIFRPRWWFELARCSWT